MRASEFLARNPQPGMSPRIQFAWALLTYLQEEGRMPLSARIEYKSEGDIILPEEWGYICEHGHLKYTHGSEEETIPETEIKDKQQMDSHIEESHRHEEDTTQTNMDNITTGNIDESHRNSEEDMCYKDTEKETNREMDKQKPRDCLMTNSKRIHGDLTGHLMIDSGASFHAIGPRLEKYLTNVQETQPMTVNTGGGQIQLHKKGELVYKNIRIKEVW